MKREIRGLKMLLIVLGLCLIVFDLLCPFPPLLGISGLTWRIIIGLASCFMIVLCILNLHRTVNNE